MSAEPSDTNTIPIGTTVYVRSADGCQPVVYSSLNVRDVAVDCVMLTVAHYGFLNRRANADTLTEAQMTRLSLLSETILSGEGTSMYLYLAPKSSSWKFEPNFTSQDATMGGDAGTEQGRQIKSFLDSCDSHASNRPVPPLTPLQRKIPVDLRQIHTPGHTLADAEPNVPGSAADTQGPSIAATDSGVAQDPTEGIPMEQARKCRNFDLLTGKGKADEEG